MAECLYDLLFMIPICLSATLLATPYLQGPEKSIWMLVVSLLSLGIFTVLKHWKNRIKYTIPGVAAVAVLTAILLQSAAERSAFMLRNIWILFTFLIGLGSFLSGWLIASNRISRRIFSAAIFIFLVQSFFLWRIDSKPAVALMLFLLLLFAADEIQYGWKKSGYPDMKKHLVFIAPFLLVLAFAVFQIPSPKKPLDWTYVLRAAKQVASYVKENTIWLHTSEDYEAEIGFSDEGAFMGKVTGKSKEMMHLKADVGAENTIYLGGKVMDSFNGREWTENYNDENKDRLIDTIEMLCAVNSYDAEHANDYIRRTNITLTFRDFYTKYCFAPMKAVPGERGFGNVEWTQKGGDLIAKKQLGYKKNYLVSYYKQNTGHEKFREMVNTPSEITADEWDEICRRYATNFFVPYEEYLNYMDKMYQVYLPETKVSGETEKYLAEILDGCDTDYEKCRQIESMLSSMQYTKTPGELPEYVDSAEDYLDYLLFEKQEGYCSHFATAFVLLARNQGIPARLVQGYRVTPIGGKTVSIQSDAAHAWAEAYFEGIGWVVFDPTPGAPEANYWAAEDEKENTAASSPAGMELPEKKDPVNPSELAVVPVEKKKAFHWKYVLIPVSAMIFMLFVYLILERIIGKARYRKLSAEEKFLASCRKNIRILEYLGYRFEPGETAEEYAQRVRKKMDGENVAFIEPYEKLCYAECRPGEAELELASENTKRLLLQLKKAKGRRYILYYFRLMKYT